MVYSKIRETYDISKLNGNAESAAYFTHFLQNQEGEIGDLYRDRALEYQNSFVESGMVEEEEFQYQLSLNWDIPFPPVSNPDFTFIDLFAGIGGFRIAAQAHGGKCVFSSEYDKFAMKTYEKNFGEVPFGDITKIDADQIPKHDILFAGFPCQPFSYAGRNEGFKDKVRGTLFFDVLRIIEHQKPKAFLLENVKGLKSHNKGETLKTIIQSLKDLEYEIYTDVLSSYDFGLPQMRQRWYCVGLPKGVPFKFPVGTGQNPKLRDIVDFENNEPSLKLSDFELQRIKFHFKNVNQELPRVQHDSSMYEPNTKKGKHGIYSYQKKDKSLRFHVGDHAKTQIQEAFYACLDTYAPTIIANRVPKLWDLERKLSVIESKKLQGFPDEFTFPVSDNQAYKQIGNSVSVPVISALIKNIKSRIL